jgi:hypothetical protein
MERDEPIGLLIGDVRRRIRQAVSSRVRRYHLSTQQFGVLVAIYAHPGFSLGELATHLQMDDPTASRVVFALAKRKLVQVRDDRADRRRSRLTLVLPELPRRDFGVSCGAGADAHSLPFPFFCCVTTLEPPPYREVICLSLV